MPAFYKPDSLSSSDGYQLSDIVYISVSALPRVRLGILNFPRNGAVRSAEPSQNFLDLAIFGFFDSSRAVSQKASTSTGARLLYVWLSLSTSYKRDINIYSNSSD